MMISVYLIDDHPTVRAGFRRLLECEDDIYVAGEAASGEAAYSECLKSKPDVIILDISMPGEGGLAFIRRFLHKEEQAKLIVMSMHEDSIFFTHAFQLGAKAYLTKSGDSEDLAEAVRAVAEGNNWVSPELAQKVVCNFNPSCNSPVDILTTREFEIFLLLSQGKSAHEISDVLHISPKTVNVHRANLMGKLKVKNSVELAHIAMRMNMIQT